ncbi:AAA family ATPase [Ancylobacter pratisalsi]|uniref:AAA family ATPase n=1 Tax=Ancylobacter pratisalsi TaxID=1745854 RepID=A0A6P1YRR0_9HYPH|nr:AAA family ATPase [Ancylobacter pratisalsi]
MRARPPAGPRSSLRLIDPRSWADKPVPERKWIVPELVPLRNVTLLSGDGALGKTLLMLQLMAAVSRGERWVGADVEPCRAFGFLCEDDADELQRRWTDIAAEMQCGLDEIGGVTLVSRAEEEDNALMSFNRVTDKGEATPLFRATEEAVLDSGARLAVFDSVHNIFTGNENSRPQVQQFVSMFRGLAVRMNGAVILAGHPSQAGLASGSGTSGSTAWNNAVRSRLYLSRPEAAGEDGGEADRDLRALSSKKSNYGPGGNEMILRWRNGVFVRELPESPLSKNARATAADAAFLACIDMALAQGRPASDAPQSPRFAPRFFRSLPPARGVREKELRAAMERLFASGAVVVGKVKGPDRHDVKAIIRGAK